MKFIKIFLVSVLFTSSALANTNLVNQLQTLEKNAHGTLGVAVINTAAHQQFGYHAKHRFSMCSTVKFMTCAAILKKSMTDSSFLYKKIKFKKSDLVSYSPITEKHIKHGMTVADLCAASVSFSDNSAQNFLVKQLGGVEAVNHFARSIGDNTFRLDRLEPYVSVVTPHDKRDSTSAHAMATSMQNILLGSILGKNQRTQLLAWLINAKTGDHRIRAGLPKGWRVGDKTGTGTYGTTNDIAIVWPPHANPIIMVIYFRQNTRSARPNDKVIASAAKIIIQNSKILPPL